MYMLTSLKISSLESLVLPGCVITDVFWHWLYHQWTACAISLWHWQTGLWSQSSRQGWACTPPLRTGLHHHPCPPPLWTGLHHHPCPPCRQACTAAPAPCGRACTAPCGRACTATAAPPADGPAPPLLPPPLAAQPADGPASPLPPLQRTGLQWHCLLPPLQRGRASTPPAGGPAPPTLPCSQTDLYSLLDGHLKLLFHLCGTSR